MTNYNNIMVIKYDRLPVFTQGYHTPLECLNPFQAIQRVPLNCRYRNPISSVQMVIWSLTVEAVKKLTIHFISKLLA